MKAAENHVFLIFICSILSFSTLAQVQFFPPHWFRGLAEQRLELMVYSPEGFGAEPEVQIDADIEFSSFYLGKPQSNDRYLFIDLDLKGLRSEALEITINGKDYTYNLKEPHRAGQALSSADALYLITPDRFANGQADNDHPLNMKEVKYGREHDFGRHGGDLKGIIDKLDYIQDLGFTATWISPLMVNDEFKESYHGYAITDHYNIDPRFGDLDLYRNYVESSHRKGMKVVMDVVYNHVGSQHLFHLDPPDSTFFHFDMMKERSNFRAVNVIDPHASQADKKKFSAGWFDDHMPDVNQQQAQFANFLIQNSLWWILEFGIDAFRIDTYAYPDQAFMAELARRIKLERPDFFLFGEIWVHHPEIQSFFAGGNPHNPNQSGLDAVTDFQFRYALKESLEQKQSWNGGVAKLYYRLAADYLYEHPEHLITFVDNHDEPRIFGELHQDLAKMKVAFGVLYTMRGIPCTYYGTEILMKETASHGVIRQDFPGGFPGDSINKFDRAQLQGPEKDFNQYLRDLLEFRAQSSAITEGRFLHFVPKNDVYAYFRISESETVMVLLNTNPEESRTVDLKRFKEAWKFQESSWDFRGQKIGPSDTLLLEPMSIGIFKQDP